MKVYLSDANHLFRKLNLVTLDDAQGTYDIMYCENCGIKGKCRDLHSIEIDGRSKIKALRCTQSKEEFDKQTAINKYNNDSKESDIQCPKCKKNVRILDEWMEEGQTEITAVTAVCPCGFDGLIHLTNPL
ncbi:hypothetical protein LCGC14_0370990 [marine sediment metagenome]|uniref:Uncharacterized protein n=1 Tax=marine sediment metagenome TaxID=412755 RepID=A0A0F9WDV7_9ZZZZ|nr:hypothetical protein [Maribacter sp.]HDZ04858.1 hypothetical protein [Maribacter sp.]